MAQRKSAAAERPIQPVDSQPEKGADVERRFRELVQQWQHAVRPSWSVHDMITHEAYQRIVALGPPAIPLILREMQRRPDHWFMALHLLTGADPAAGTGTGSGAT